MDLVFRKSRKTRKLRKAKKQTKRRSICQVQKGGYPAITPNMIIKYAGDIQLASGQMNVDMTKQYNLGHLDKEPLLEITGLEFDKRYILIMTDSYELSKTWIHWIVEIISNNNGAGQLVRPAIVKYAPPNPPNNSGIHRYIFRLYDTSTLSKIPSSLENMSRGDYFANKLQTIIKDKPVLAEAAYTIDSRKIKIKIKINKEPFVNGK